jgi:hypothetical protein
MYLESLIKKHYNSLIGIIFLTDTEMVCLEDNIINCIKYGISWD